MDNSKDLVPAPVSEETTHLAVETKTQVAQPPAPTSPETHRTATVEAPAPQSGGLATEAADASADTALGRPVPPRPRPRTPVRRRRNPWGWIMVVLLAIAAGVGTFLYVRSTQTNPAFQGQTTAATTRLPVSVSVGSNGQVQANADLGVTFSASGTVTKLYKKLGDSVKAGETLAQIDDTDLQFAVKSAQASFDQAQANYNKSTAGATQKELEVAQAQVDGAKANLNNTINGTFTAQDVASAQASINSAAAKLAQTRQGGNPQDLAAAQAAISSAEAQLASARAKLAKTQAGPDTATVIAAQVAYDQAVANYERNLSSLKLAITNAEVTRDKTLNALTAAQEKYNKIYWDNRNGDGKLKDNLKDSQIQDETNALRSMQDAQGEYNRSDIALNDARVALSTQTRSLQATIDKTKADLDKTRAGPTAADLAADQASVASAQASLDNARKSLAALTPTQAQLAADEAQLASAQASLAKLRGGTPDQITASEASLRQAQATLDDLLRGTKPNDIAIAKAQLDVAQTSLDKAKATAANAVLKSPISGTVVKADLLEGQPVSAATVVYQIVDLSSLHIDVNVGESDISKIKLDMPVAINLDAIAGRSFSGKVRFISSKSTVSNNVVSYLVTVQMDTGNANSLFEAYQSEFNKLIQRPGGQGQGQGRGAAPGGAAPGGAAPGGFQIPANAQLPRGAAAQITAATGVCGYNLVSLADQGTGQLSPKVGMTANITFCLNLKAGVLSVPNRVIKSKLENGQRLSYVEVLVDRDTNKIEQRPVLTGLAGDNYTEITGGDLKDGDLIVLSTTPTNTNNGANRQQVPGPGGQNILR